MINENKPNTEDSGDIGSDKSDDKIANLSNSIKVKKRFEISFLTLRASLAFT